MHRPSQTIGFLGTTAIGGLLFLLPVFVLGFLLGQVVPIVLAVAAGLGTFLPAQTPGGVLTLVLLSLGILLTLCFLAGLMARRQYGQRASHRFEKRLLLLFPRYAIIKEHMNHTIGGQGRDTTMKPVLVRFDDRMQIAFETERCEESQLVVVYLPSSPDPWTGKVVLVHVDRVESLSGGFGKTTLTCEQLGRGSLKLLEELRVDPPARRRTPRRPARVRVNTEIEPSRA